MIVLSPMISVALGCFYWGGGQVSGSTAFRLIIFVTLSYTEGHLAGWIDARFRSDNCK
jgi:hypothetical protein